MSVYNKIITLSLALLMLFNTFYVAITYAYYYLDQSDFIALFCKNIDKPELKCNGKCHLKEVVKEQTNTDQIPSKKFVLKKITLFFEKPQQHTLYVIVDKKSNQKKYLNLYCFENLYEFYHPPQA